MSNTIDLGPIGQGEQPLPLLHTFTYPDLSPADLTGFTATWYDRPEGGTTQTKSGLVLSDGQVQITWDPTDFQTPGVGIAELWVVSSANRFLARFTYTVQPTIGG